MSVIFSDPRTMQAPPDLSGREDARREFLAAWSFGDWTRTPLAGDASTRAYERLTKAGEPPRVFMDAPPAAEQGAAPADASPADRIALGYNAMARLAACRVDAFAAIADWLLGHGLSAPQVFASDADAGFAVIEDLGRDLFTDRLAAGDDPVQVYGAATDLLAELQSAPPPACLPAPGGGAWALPVYDALALRTGLDLFIEWWWRFKGLPPLGEDAAAEWVALWAPVLARGEAGATVFTHRDYHAENLLWLPERAGVARVGLLDFQDAVRGHPAWDLFHLLQDARRDVAPEIEAAMVARFLARRSELQPEAFRADYAALGALNAARILGPVFARQITAFGRDKYRAFLPRTWRALERNLAHPDMAAIRAWFDRHVPPEARA